MANDSKETEPLVAAMVASFPAFVAERLEALGVAAGNQVNETVAAAADRLGRELRDLLDRPARDQIESPLELVRRATHPITQLLDAMGIAPVERDDWEVANQPEDPYCLYPASAQQLGEEAWHLHLDWGVRKAESLAGVVPKPSVSPQVPPVALFGIPIAERDELLRAIQARGFNVLVWRNPAALENAAMESPVMVLVHLEHPQAHHAIRKLSGAGIRVVATGDEVTDLTIPGLMALGAADVVESTRLLARLDRLLPDRA